MVTNDDGIDSPGLHAVVDALHDLGEIVVAAPSTQQTAQGRSMNGDRSVSFHRADHHRWPSEVRAYHIAATPALAVRHGLAVLTSRRVPDLLVSGINYGENLGTNITISGTVGAAIQGASQGIPSLAVSRQTPIEHHYRYGELDWMDAARVARAWTRRMLTLIAGKDHGNDHRNGQSSPNDIGDDVVARAYDLAGTLPFHVLKIDIPDPCPPGTEERITRLSRRPYFTSVMDEPRPESPLAQSVVVIDLDSSLLDPEDDIYAVAVDRVVSVTPLTLDCTAPMDRSRSLLLDARATLSH
jgi:5'-nucleotidase